MLDIRFISENAELIKAGATKKRINADIDRLLAVDDRRRTLRLQLDEKRAEQNRASGEISRASGFERTQFIEAMQHLKADMSVPEDDSDAQNLEVRQWGTLPTLEKPKSHLELMTTLDMVDFDRGTKVAGFRGYFLKNDGVLLSYALWQFFFEQCMKRGGFTPMLVPSLVRRESLLGTGFIPQSEEDLYKTQDDEYLAGTAEVATMGYHADEILDAHQLPLKYFSFSPCFRREAGAHGKDTKGLVRVHEFFKFEQVILCEASHETSVKYHEELTTA